MSPILYGANLNFPFTIGAFALGSPEEGPTLCLGTFCSPSSRFQDRHGNAGPLRFWGVSKEEGTGKMSFGVLHGLKEVGQWVIFPVYN